MGMNSAGALTLTFIKLYARCKLNVRYIIWLPLCMYIYHIKPKYINQHSVVCYVYIVRNLL